MNRRDLLKTGAALSAIPLLTTRAPALITANSARPVMPYGVMSGDLLPDRAMIWAAVDRPSQMVVEWSRDPGFSRGVRRTGPLATTATDLTAKLDLTGLPGGQHIHYRVAFHDPDNTRAISDWSYGRLRLPGPERRRLRFTFSGDECGQGFGINPDHGGYRLYEAMRQKRPDFFIHQGDQIYADGPLKEQVTLPDGTIWRNNVTPAKSKVADSLADYHGNFSYNLTDANKRRFLAEVPMLVQWDDHEVRNNWFPDKPMASGPSMRDLSGWARQAMLDYNPMRIDADAPGIQRVFSMGPLLDVFILDARSRRGPNGGASSTAPGAGMFGPEQIAWLKRALKQSKAVWKLIASDMPLSLTVTDFNKDVAPGGMEGLANGKPGAPGGREAELADLLSFIHTQRVANTVWISADVHHAVALHYHPDRAAYDDFTPFWEFVSGPINAGTGNLAANAVDPTFGPQVKFTAVPDAIADTSPHAGKQFFGLGEIDPQTKALTMSINDALGRELARFELPANLV